MYKTAFKCKPRMLKAMRKYFGLRKYYSIRRNTLILKMNAE